MYFLYHTFFEVSIDIRNVLCNISIRPIKIDCELRGRRVPAILLDIIFIAIESLFNMLLIDGLPILYRVAVHFLVDFIEISVDFIFSRPRATSI